MIVKLEKIIQEHLDLDHTNLHVCRHIFFTPLPSGPENWHTFSNTVKPRPVAHMDMILFEVFLKSIDLIPQQQILQRHYLDYNVIVLSDLVESSGYSSKTLQKGSCPYAPLDEALQMACIQL